MGEALKQKFRESLRSVLPITAVVCALCFFVVPLRLDAMMLFLCGAAMLVVGLGVFTLGADMAMSRMGERIGAHITKRRSLPLLLIIAFIVGFIVTIAEPDLTVLAEKFQALPNWTIIISVALGVSVFMAVAMWRMVYRVSLRMLLLICYAAIIPLSFFVPKEFIAAAFDSGGVTTGAITVPFMLAMGAGVASVRSDSESVSDSFGMVALCSVGPILVMLLLGLIIKPESSVYERVVLPVITNTTVLFSEFLRSSAAYFKDVFISLFPLVAFYALFQAVFIRKADKHDLVRTFVGVLYTYVGLVIFLTGVNVGFMPAGTYLGEELAKASYRWILIPLGLLIGYFIVATEPAVHALNHQVEEMTDGAIRGSTIQIGLGVGVGISVALSMVRVLTGLSLYWIIVPGYSIAMIMTRFSPKIFTAIAFDSGGVASGPMTATFLLPFAIGACTSLGGDISSDAFGLVALVAMTPLITIQAIGIYYDVRQRRAVSELESIEPEELAEEIIDLDLSDAVMEAMDAPHLYEELEGSSAPKELNELTEMLDPQELHERQALNELRKTSHSLALTEYQDGAPSSPAVFHKNQTADSDESVRIE
ncbi:MAG: DUF1538 domain-containing protein [Oscillospiraceae bacterium]|jgi:hypothetical protein|nr:DUF1538 domain-containing protein [Oscillospiraceae bacterium]